MSEHITKNSLTLGREAIFEKNSKISQLPVYLNVQFVRFFWRQDKNLRAKICKVCRIGNFYFVSFRILIFFYFF